MAGIRTLRVASVLALLVATSGFWTSAAQTAPTCLGKTATIFGQSGDIKGTADADVIVGSAKKDKIKGLGGHDIMCGGGGNDKLLGGGGGDSMDGGAGDDIINGQENPQPGSSSLDAARYDDAPSHTTGGEVKGVKVNLGLGLGEGWGEDTIVNVQGVMGSNFDDTLRGDSGPDTMDGGPGDDTLFGLGGADGLFGNEGMDILSPGSGPDTVSGDAASGVLALGPGGDPPSDDDTVSYRGAPGSVTVKFGEFGDGEATGAWDADMLGGVENTAGSNFADHLVGDHYPNQLLGYKGHDLIEAGEGPDLLDGGADDDIMRSGPGNDTVIGGDGSNDTASYEDAYGEVTASLATGVVQPDGHGGSDTLIETENLIASYGVVNFTGDEKDNILIGCDKADTIDGGGGNDTIHGGLLGDSLDGGAGSDTIYGEDGDDTIHGGSENDFMYGGTYVDTIYGDEGNNDLANGGTGGDPDLLENDTCDAEGEEQCERNPQPERAHMAQASVKPIL